MTFDLQMIQQLYDQFQSRIDRVKHVINRPLTFTEKILFAHLAPEETTHEPQRGIDYANFMPDRVAMQDATAQMALLQLMNSGRERVAVPTTVHCDHLIQAHIDADTDLKKAKALNQEVYDFLRSASNKHGIGFWRPGAGIIHQVVLEKYAFPGGMMIGTDSHTPNAGGLGMIAIGVGGADAVDVMIGMPWELKMPRIIGVELTGELSGWSSPKDVILKLSGILTVKGGTNAIIEYFGPGVSTLSATGKASICNMGAEVGATCSLFPFDDKSAKYLESTMRVDVATIAHRIRHLLKADPEVEKQPEQYYDQVIKIDLSALEPYINGPFTPDAAYPLSSFAEVVKRDQIPQEMEVGLIGSCTNSSYEDLSRAASIMADAKQKGVTVKAKLIITPGSDQIRDTMARDGITAIFEEAGGIIMANACGPCIGQWRREEEKTERRNSIVTSFNRNFAKRNDGNPNTYAFVASPEVVTALAIAGDLCFNPLTDTLLNDRGERILLSPPQGEEQPPEGYVLTALGYVAPEEDGSAIEVVIDPQSERLQRLARFDPWDGREILRQPLLIKVKGKCTTDHISMAGSWLRFRGHLDNISDNMLMGAVNVFNDQTNSVRDPADGTMMAVSTLARRFKRDGLGSVVIAEENYGEGSSREHAAMEPRFLNVKAIIAKSFARIHETNLKKQGMLALTFIDKEDYERVQEGDQISILGLTSFAPGQPLTVELHHVDGSSEQFEVQQSYNQAQIEWFKAGSALNT